MAARRSSLRSEVLSGLGGNAAILAAGLSSSLLASSPEWWCLAAGLSGSLASGPILLRLGTRLSLLLALLLAFLDLVWCSAVGLGRSLVSGPILLRLGTRLSLLLALLLAFLGCLTVILGWPAWGRLLTGSACGLCLPPAFILLYPHAASSHVRCLLASLALPAFALGIYCPVLASVILEEAEWTCAVGCLCCLLAVLFCVSDGPTSPRARPRPARSLLLSSALAFLTTLSVLTVLINYTVEPGEGAACLSACLAAGPLAALSSGRAVASYAGYVASLALLLLPPPFPLLPPSPIFPPTPSQLPLIPSLPTEPPLLHLTISSPPSTLTPPQPPFVPSLSSDIPLLLLAISSSPSLPTPTIPTSLSLAPPSLVFTLPPVSEPPSFPPPSYFLLTFLATSSLSASALLALIGEVFLPDFQLMGPVLAGGWLASLLALARLPLPASTSAYVLATILIITLLVPPKGQHSQGKKGLEAPDGETTQPLQDLSSNIEFIKVSPSSNPR